MMSNKDHKTEHVFGILADSCRLEALILLSSLSNPTTKVTDKYWKTLKLALVTSVFTQLQQYGKMWRRMEGLLAIKKPSRVPFFYGA